MVRRTFCVGANPAAGKPIPPNDFGIEPAIELISAGRKRRLTLGLLAGLTLMSAVAIPLAAPRLLTADIFLMVGLMVFVGSLFARRMGGGWRTFLLASSFVAGSILYYRLWLTASERWLIAAVAETIFALAFAQHSLYRMTVHPVDSVTAQRIRKRGMAAVRRSVLAISIGGACFALVPPVGLLICSVLVLGHLVRLAFHPRRVSGLFTEALVSWSSFDYVAARGAVFRSPVGSWPRRVLLMATVQFLLTAAIGASLYGQAGVRSDSYEPAASDPMSIAVLGPFMLVLAAFPTGLTLLSAFVGASAVLIAADRARAKAESHVAWDVITEKTIPHTKPRSIPLGNVAADRTPVTYDVDDLVYGVWLLGRPGSGKTAAACKILRWVILLNQFADTPSEDESSFQGGS